MTTTHQTKKDTTRLWKEYVSAKRARGCRIHEYISRCRFLKIVKAVTSGQQTSKKCMEYMLVSLVYNNFHLLGSIVDRYVQSKARKDELHELLIATVDFLKHGFTRHVDDGDYCVQKSRYALSETHEAGPFAELSSTRRMWHG